MFNVFRFIPEYDESNPICLEQDLPGASAGGHHSQVSKRKFNEAQKSPRALIYIAKFIIKNCILVVIEERNHLLKTKQHFQVNFSLRRIQGGYVGSVPTGKVEALIFRGVLAPNGG